MELREGWSFDDETGAASGPVRPFQLASKVVCDRVTVRRLKGRDMKVAAELGDGVSATFKLISRLTGLQVADVYEMDADDIGYISEIIGFFTGGGRVSGGQS